jgi:protein TonB
VSDIVIQTEKISVDDRLSVTLLLTGLFHLIVILGISFSVMTRDDDGAVPTLEVLLVSEALPESPENDQARYLAQRTQQGAGNIRESARSQLPTLSNSPLDSPGELDGASAQDPFAAPSGGEAERLISAADSRGARYLADAESPAAASAETPRQLLAGAETTLPSSEDDPDLRLKGPQRRELMVTPSTRESAATLYIDSWRRRVERVGTLNFPNQARRRGLSGSPVIEVALASDGQLADMKVRRSSGHPDLDQAALQILRLSAPFEPFSRELAARYDVIRFAYEWQFVGGELTGSSVRLPADSP